MCWARGFGPVWAASAKTAAPALTSEGAHDDAVRAGLTSSYSQNGAGVTSSAAQVMPDPLNFVPPVV